MDTTEFLRKILPAHGLYVIARLTGKGFRHQVCETVEEAAAYALQFDASGVPTYHACAAYREASVDIVKPNGDTWHQVRTHKNVRTLKAFWMDLDVKPDTDGAYRTQEEAIEGLCTFLQETDLPPPMVISSGNGIHIYWTLTDEILPETWKQTANSLKALAASLGFKADHACTSDPARILRPVGTWNRKTPGAPRAVECIRDAEDVSFASFHGVVIGALHAAGIKPPEAVRQVESNTETLNQAFAVQHEFPPCSAVKVADRCKQLAQMRDTRGCVSEPHWYAGIQLMCHAIEGDPLIHLWSNGYSGYSAEETDRKIAQVREHDMGPTLCVTFADRNMAGCEGCPFKGKISSPAQLGTHIASAPAPVVSFQVADTTVVLTIPNPPVPFTRGEKGGIYIEDEGITHKIYEYDCFPIELAWDEQLGYETMRWRHWLPQEGWKEFVMRSSLLARPVDFETQLRDNHIQPLIRNKMAMFGDAYIRKLRTDNKLRQLFKSQGWKNDDTEFVLGDKLYREDEIVQAGFSHGAKGFLKNFYPKGDLEIWRTLTSVLGQPGFEPHAFVLLLAFAAPLLKLDARQGFTVSALGDTGAGKSTMAMFMSSVYGHPDQTWMKRDDTLLARMQRIGAYFSLPVYMDEATTIPNKELRELVYTMSTGKGRDSMRQDYTLREGAEWSTILLTSTNDSLQAKLQLEKQNADAESMRLFEFKFPVLPAFAPIAKIIRDVLKENFGTAGPVYIRYITEQRARIRAELGDIIEAAEKSFGMDSKERFWSQAVALSLYGGKLARECGVIDFDSDVIKPWLLAETRHMRSNIADNEISSVSILGEYLNAHIGERLVVTTLNAGMTAQNARPSKELSQRLEKDANMLYVSRTHIKRWLDSKHFNYSDIKDEMFAKGVLLNPDVRKVLGAGTDLTGGQVPCWKIRADHPELGLLLTD